MISPKDKNDGGTIRYVTRKIWVNDDNWLSSFDLIDKIVTVMNRDEDPLSNKNKDIHTQYMHGGVSVSGNILAIGLVSEMLLERHLIMIPLIGC